MTDRDYQEFLEFKAWRAARERDRAEQRQPTEEEPRTAPASAPSRRQTVRELWAAWEPVARRTFKSFQGLQSTMRLLCDLSVEIDGQRVLLGDLPWNRCDARAWDAAVQVLLTMRTHFGRQGYANGTINQMRVCLATMFRHHRQRGTISGHPLKDAVTLPGRERHGYFSEQQLREYLSCCHPTFAKMMVTACACGGLRMNEVRLLRKDEIRWDERVIYLPAERNKNGKARVIPIPDDVFALLQRQRIDTPGDYLFPKPSDPRGGPMSKAGIHHWSMRARARWGKTLAGELPTPHHARHTFAQTMILKGASLRDVMAPGGWSSYRHVLRYTKLDPEGLERVRDLGNMTVAEAKEARKAPQRGKIPAEIIPIKDRK